nr:SMC-Scp complex subunit ScpB [Luteimonas salinisoli]
MDQPLITRIVEAALLAASQPLSVAQLRGLFTLDEPAPEGAVEQALETLQAGCSERGVELVEVASGWRFQVAGDVHAWVARLWTERQTKYTRATLETLALIAYRQPITRGEIEQVRGVATNSNIIKALEEREWIRVVGHRDIPGRPELLGTTKGFLDYFGLKRLDELPPLSELKDFGELEPQFKFDPGAPDGEAMPVGDLPAEGAANGPGEAGGEAIDAEGGTPAGSGTDIGSGADASSGIGAGPATDSDTSTDAGPEPDPESDTGIQAGPDGGGDDDPGEPSGTAAPADGTDDGDGFPSEPEPHPDDPTPSSSSDDGRPTPHDIDTQNDALAADGDSERSTS